MEVSPGQFETLPTGVGFQEFDPQHPTQAFPFFVKACLRGIASGLGVSYNTLANDLEGVNFSSIRAGVLDEREEYKAIQGWLIEQFCEPVFEAWLDWQLGVFLTLPLPLAKFDKFNSPDWKPRRWPWVDPLKDVQANVIAVENGFRSRRSIIAEGGGDVEDTFEEIAADNELAASKKLVFGPASQSLGPR